MGNKEIEQCNLCGNEGELCGTTRGNAYTEGTKDQERPKNRGSILNNADTK